MIKDYSALEIIGAVCLATFVFVMLRAHLSRTSPIDLTDLITEYAHHKRRVTMSRFAAFVGLTVGTWAFVFALTGGNLGRDWEGILAFMGATFTYRAADSFLKVRRDTAASDAREPDGDDVPIDGDGDRAAHKSAKAGKGGKGDRLLS